MSEPAPAAPMPLPFVEDIELDGHIIDSLLLPKVLDEILKRGGTFTIKEITLGQRQVDPMSTTAFASIS